MNSMKYTVLALASVFTLLSCTPSHETTAGLCESNQNNSVSSNHISFKLLVDSNGVVSKEEQDLENSSEQDDNEYKLYLQDVLNALPRTSTEVNISTPDEGVQLTEEQTTKAIESMINLFNKAGLNYTVNEDGVVTSADNPIDFIEYLITSTDDEEKIQAFVDAKKQMAAGIKADDDFCAYRNTKIQLNLVEEDEDDKNKINTLREVFAELRMRYDPFNLTFDQNIILADNITVLDSAIARRDQTPFVGFYRSDPEDFKAKGFTPPTDRFSSLNSSDNTEIYHIDDDFDDKLGQLEFITFDDFCYKKKTKNGKLKLDDNGNEIIKLDDDDNPITTDCHPSIFNKLCYLEESIDTGEKDDDENPIYETTQTYIEDCDDAQFDPVDAIKVCKIELYDGLGNPVEIDVPLLDDDGNEVLDDDGEPIVNKETKQGTINCQKNQTSRISEHDECSAETDTRISRSFDLLLENDTVLSNVHRLRLETDYESEEVRFYASSYNEIVLRATKPSLDEDGIPELEENGDPKLVNVDQDIENPDSTDYIVNPTRCEKQAILDELAIIEDIDATDSGVRLTAVPDPNYDIRFEVDDDGKLVKGSEEEPIPVFSYQGTIIPDRK